jgi:hypothetical protein
MNFLCDAALRLKDGVVEEATVLTTAAANNNIKILISLIVKKIKIIFICNIIVLSILFV